MSTPNRVPAGVPTGGQFAASAREEAALRLALHDGPASGPADEQVGVDAATRTRFVTDSVLMAGRALRVFDDSSPGYHEGIAVADIEAHLLAYRDRVPEPHEVARDAEEFLTDQVAPNGQPATAATLREYADNLAEPDAMTWEQAQAVSDHFLRRAIFTADQIAAARRRGEPAWREYGYLNAAAEWAIAYRRPESYAAGDNISEADRLATDLIARAEERVDTPARFRPGGGQPSVEEAREVWDEHDVHEFS